MGAPLLPTTSPQHPSVGTSCGSERETCGLFPLHIHHSWGLQDNHLPRPGPFLFLHGLRVGWASAGVYLEPKLLEHTVPPSAADVLVTR